MVNENKKSQKRDAWPRGGNEAACGAGAGCGDLSRPGADPSFPRPEHKSPPPRCITANAAEDALTLPLPSLPAGDDSYGSYLLAPLDFECRNCPLPKFLHGEKPSKHYSPPVYATIHACHVSATRRGGRSADHTVTLDTPTSHTTTDSTVTNPPHMTAESTGTSPHMTTDDTVTLNTHSPHTTPTERTTTEQLNPSAGPQTLPTSTTLSTTDTSITKTNVNLSKHTTQSDSLEFPTSVPAQASPVYQNNNVTKQHLLHSTEDTNGGSNSSQQGKTTQAYTLTSTNKNHSSTRNPIVTPTDTNSTTHPSQLSNYTLHNILQLQEEASTDTTDPSTHHSNEKRHTDNNLLHEQTFTVTYWMFYPYNQGKSVCTMNFGWYLGRGLKPRISGLCHGEEVVMGNHVGDWEHVSIQFKGKQPQQMYVSTHNFGAYYRYDPHRHEFVYTGQDTRKGLAMSPSYPKTVQLKGSNPVLYSALGSHGLWGAPGEHVYVNLPLLKDATGKGSAWKTWNNLSVIDFRDPEVMARNRHWWSYKGRWGNPSTRCHLLLGGYCELVEGPTGIPLKRINFPCQQQQ